MKLEDMCTTLAVYITAQQYMSHKSMQLILQLAMVYIIIMHIVVHAWPYNVCTTIHTVHTSIYSCSFICIIMQSAFSWWEGGREIAIGHECMPGHACARSVAWWRKVFNKPLTIYV